METLGSIEFRYNKFRYYMYILQFLFFLTVSILAFVSDQLLMGALFAAWIILLLPSFIRILIGHKFTYIPITNEDITIPNKHGVDETTTWKFIKSYGRILWITLRLDFLNGETRWIRLYHLKKEDRKKLIKIIEDKVVNYVK
jgi:hypothetical protein